LNDLKEKLMPRPKSSKNRTVEQEAPKQPVQEFDYDTMGDTAYAQIMSGSIPQVAPAWTQPTDDETAALVSNEPIEPISAVTLQPMATDGIQLQNTLSTNYLLKESLYLVEGKVRLDQMGSPPIHADQRRIVSATSDDEALQKFMRYFANMSNEMQTYTVVSAAASGAIL
jgi:hypothetical protein